ncbi:alpha/beta fold hydrolase [Mesorhizobium escarrei]|uniref:Alpha/beta hydrolase n=1 Tax=Mesorhizobium escarrei TaxID=666018 RepID=A0ABM9EFC1_9HYPH|nr:hypothetical protein [Mesorhizobium escarrei]CAH2407489.1 hypothetical protein MES5069_60117 [Mesorhizobium escarrei]
MWRDISPDDQVDIRVDGHRIRAYSFGKGANIAIPKAEVSMMRKSSHLPFYENPDDYYRVLIDFLSRHGAKT